MCYHALLLLDEINNRHPTTRLADKQRHAALRSSRLRRISVGVTKLV